MEIKRGDIYYADLGATVGSEQGGERPVLIIQNNVGNRHSPTVIAASITSRQNKAPLPTHVFLHAGAGNLPCDSVVLMEQIRTIDKRRLKGRVGRLNKEEMAAAERAMLISFGVQLVLPGFERDEIEKVG